MHFEQPSGCSTGGGGSPGFLARHLKKVAATAGKLAKPRQELDFRCTWSQPCLTMEGLLYHLSCLVAQRITIWIGADGSAKATRLDESYLEIYIRRVSDCSGSVPCQGRYTRHRHQMSSAPCDFISPAAALS